VANMSVPKMLSAIMGVSPTPKGQDKKRAKKSMGEGSVTEPGQQHGELASYKEPTDGERIKDEAKHQKRRATEDWIAGRITTKEHGAVHERAQHVLHGRHPREFKGMSGERKGKYL
jgi:hypothetical protein